MSLRLLILTSVLAAGPAAAEVVVFPGQATGSAQIEKSFARALKSRSPSTGIRKVVEGETPEVVFAIGAAAATAARTSFPTTPMVATLERGDLRGHPNATAIRLDAPFDLELAEIKRLLPNVKVVGIVYGPENAAVVARVKRSAARLGLKIEARKVNSARELPVALNAIKDSAQMLWGLPDKVVLTQRTAQHVLLFSVRNRLPFVGPSPPWAKAGALFAFDLDFDDVGAQAGETVAAVLQGKPASSIPTASPRKLNYAVNQKTAGHLRITLSQAVLKSASQRF